MTGFRTLLKRHSLGLGSTAVLAPLAVLLVLQSRWLARLEQTTAAAQEHALENCIEAVGAEIRYFYLAAAERALNLPPSIFVEGRLATAGAYWAKKPVEGARSLFLVDFTRDTYGNYYVYDAEEHRLASLLASDESLAIVLACSPWQMLSHRRVAAAAPVPLVDERDPAHRIVLEPITDGDGGVLGVAGMVLDEEYFRDRLLPAVIARVLASFFPDGAQDDVVVTVRDSKHRTVFRTREDGRDEDAVAQNIPFVFTDWTVGLRRGGTTPARWARANFAANMALAVLLALVLAGGVLLALRAADRAMRLSRLKSDFVSNVSHELRTPLASIRVFGELLRTGRVQAPERVREYGEHIESESRRLSRLVENLLDFARIESGRKTYRFERVDVREVVEAVGRSFEPRLRGAGFRLHVERPDEPLVADADADALGQAVGNLLDNAIKYSGPARDVRVTLGEEGREIVVAVQDHGIGIEPSEQERIFERFHRVGSALVHDVKGAGLGLAIVHHVVGAHRGRVTVASEPGKGSTFAIRLPRPTGAAPPTGAPPATGEP